MKPIKIGLIDDQKLFTYGLASLLSKEYGFEVVFEAHNGEDLKYKLKEDNLPDVVTLDPKMPIMDGIATARWLREEYPNIRVLVLTGSMNTQTIMSMVRLGVRGCLSKDSDVGELVVAIKNLNDGMVYFPEYVTRIIVESMSNNDGEVKLSLMEKEFLKLSTAEVTYKEIADNMGITSRAADALRDQLFEKLQIKSRVGLALYAVRHKLIDL
jgi:DNA-binding NarL/FixJ family response regulator